MERYRKNIGTLTSEENEILRRKKAAVVGCGGLGGYIIVMLARLGIGALTVIDGDYFEESNLNRQLLCTVQNLGVNKASHAANYIHHINPNVRVYAHSTWLNADNARSLLGNNDVVVDGLDNISSRKLLQNACGQLKIPMVYGAIAGWYGQVATILPGENTLDRIYPKHVEEGIEIKLGTPAFTPALVAALQVAEVTKLLIGRGDLLTGGAMLIIDILNQDYYRVQL